MTRTMLALCAAVLVSVPALAQTPASSGPVPVVITQGEGIVKRAPDRALLTVVTETRAPKADEARSTSARETTAIQNALKGAGLPADAIRTTGFTLVPEMDWKNGRGTVRGYLVRNQVEVRVDDLTKLADVIDAANATRTTALTISGPRFALKDEAAAEGEALRLAVQTAMARAEAMAAGAKRTLGPISRIQENPGGQIRPEPMMMRQMASAEAAQETPITPGEIEIRANVTLTVELR